MDIQGTISSWGSNASSAASSCGSSMKSLGESAVENGKLGYNKVVKLVNDSPRTALIASVAALAFAVGVVMWGPSGSTSGGDTPPPPPADSDVPAADVVPNS